MTTMMIGTFTRQRPFFRDVGQGLGLAELDERTGRIELLDVLKELVSPSYVRPLHDGALVTCEEGEADAAIAFVSAQGRRLDLLGMAKVPGDRPCQVEADRSAALAACACYGSGHVTLHPLDPRGVPGAASSVSLHFGRSVHPERQTGPHAHAVAFSPDGAWLLAADLGTDQVWGHAVRDGAIEGKPTLWQAPDGAGPRIVSFAPDGRHVLVVMELSSEVFCLSWEGGLLRKAGRASTLPGGHVAGNSASGLRWHPSGDMFAVSNRGADRITMFGMDHATGGIARIGAVSCGGQKPRDFDFSPNGRWMAVGNQDSNELAVFSVEGERLIDTGERFRFACPACVRFL